MFLFSLPIQNGFMRNIEGGEDKWEKCSMHLPADPAREV